MWSLATPEGPVIESDGTPLDAAGVAVLLARVLADIDHAGDEERDALLSGLLSSAWPSQCARDH